MALPHFAWINLDARDPQIIDPEENSGFSCLLHGAEVITLGDCRYFPSLSKRLWTSKTETTSRKVQESQISPATSYLRGNKLSNRVFNTYEDIVDACCDAWNWLTCSPHRA